MNTADAQVIRRIQRQMIGPFHCRGDQCSRRESGSASDLIAHFAHLIWRLEETFGSATVDMTISKWNQTADGIKKIGHRRIGAIEIAHRIGEDGGQLLLLRAAQHPSRMCSGVGSISGTLVGGDSDPHLTGGYQFTPGRQLRVCQIGSPRSDSTRQRRIGSVE
jgi:hypothetical protein